MNTFLFQIILIGPFFKEICAEIWRTKGAPRRERVKPTAPDQGLKDVTRLRNLLHYSNTIVWDKLTGGGTVVFFAKDLEKHPRIYDYVIKELQDYITYVQQIYPKLKLVKGGTILSAPNSLVQIDGHYGKLHSNYTGDVLECPPDERPLSIILAVDPFVLQYLQSQEMKGKDIQRLHVNQGKTVMFANMCLHSGDTNKSDEHRLRLFAYLVSHDEDFPKNEVMLYDWTDNTEDAQIKSAALTSQKETIRRINESNIYGRKSVLRSHPPKRVRYQIEKYGFL
jgi:hypothetical protein